MLDVAAYAAIAATPTPGLDRVVRGVSRAADHWKLWLGSAAALAIAGGPRGRRAAVNGVVAMAVSSAVVHLALKPLSDRRRPDRAGHQVPMTRQVSMPTSTSFPSGHAASAAAFATGVASAFPEAGIPLERRRSARRVLPSPHGCPLSRRRDRRIRHRDDGGAAGRRRPRSQPTDGAPRR